VVRFVLWGRGVGRWDRERGGGEGEVSDGREGVLCGFSVLVGQPNADLHR